MTHPKSVKPGHSHSGGDTTPTHSPTPPRARLHTHSLEGKVVEVESVPDWSGEFVEFEGDGLGMLPIHIADTRAHTPPEGWVYDGSYDAPDSEIFIYRKAGGEW